MTLLAIFRRAPDRQPDRYQAPPLFRISSWGTLGRYYSWQPFSSKQHVPVPVAFSATPAESASLEILAQQGHQMSSLLSLIPTQQNQPR
ncbi:hypothetical protein LY78DRAFT_314930 [Colletotrichum sublineola]|nr:hypothetical protein LY78DRAFT_314930 [Colletotrichum sublineola]